jgi:ribosomal protein S18 acetylase RimI-like enzyme
MRIRSYAAVDETAVIALWEKCRLTRPWNDPRKDIARKLAVQPELFLVGVLGEAIVATVMAGYEGHRGWVNYLAVSPEHQRKGLGKALMLEVEKRLTERGCPKLNVQVRAANGEALQFYRRLGYAQDEAVALGKRLIPDT